MGARAVWVGAVVLWAVVASIGTLPFGKVDNGDFVRYTERFLADWTAPTAPGAGPNSSAGSAGSDGSDGSDDPDIPAETGWKRFWSLRPAGEPAVRAAADTGSVQLLWAPGIWASRHLRDDGRLDLRWLGVVPRLFSLGLVAAFAVLVARLARDERRPASLLVAALWALLLTAPAFTHYFHSFYRETATVLFAGATTLLLAWPDDAKGIRVGLLFAAGAGLVTSAPAHGALALPLVVGILVAAERPSRGRQLFHAALALSILALAWHSVRSARPGVDHAGTFNALFYGLLELSDRPAEHITRLGLPAEMIALVGHTAFDAESLRFRAERETLSHTDIAAVLLAEPRLVPRAALAVSRWVNQTRTRRPVYFEAGAPPATSADAWNLWGNLQRSGFPRGIPLLMGLAAALAGALILLRRASGRRRGLLLALAFTSASSLIEMGVKIVGDGKMEVPRQLAAANLFIASTAILLLWLALLWRRGPESVAAPADGAGSAT